MTDCLLIGFNDSSFGAYVDMVRGMGETSGAYRDLNLAFVELDGQPSTSMKLLNRFHFEGRPAPATPFHNCDFLWPTITYLGTYLSRRGFSFDYVNTFQLEKDALREKLLHDEVLTVAVTTTLYVSPHPILEIVSFIRQYSDRVKIVVGGPFIINQSKLLDAAELERLFQFLGADFYVISQEGEQTLVNLLTALKNRHPLSAIANLSYRDRGTFVVNSLAPENNTLEENMVDYSLFPARDLGEFVSLRTAKSCPFSCSFCGFPQRAGDYRYLSVELVEKELDALAAIGTVTTLTFLDDTFNVPKKRFKEILRMMIKNRYGFHWNSFYRSDHGDDEAIELMAEAGCEGVFLGVESGSDVMLKTMNKSARRADYLRAIPRLQSVGISTHANLIVGFPGESYASYGETISLLEEARPDFFRAQLWYADPVTPIWKRKEQFGVKGSAFAWSHDTMDYQMACDLVDRMFLCVEGPVWLPQHGFEQWSTFYLQRKGMSLPAVKAFLADFSTLVKEKLLSPQRAAPTPSLIENLRRSSRFDVAPTDAPEPVRLYAGAEYKAAESFWFAQLGGGQATSGLEALRRGETTGDAAWSELPSAVAADDLGPLCSRFQAEPTEVLLAAYALLLASYAGRSDVALLVVDEDGAGAPRVFPLRVAFSWRAGFGELLSGVRQLASRQAALPDVYGLHLATHPFRLAFGSCELPVLDAGFLRGSPEADRRDAGAAWARALADWPEIERGLCLGLAAAAGPDGLAPSLSYRDGRLGRVAAEELAAGLTALLQRIAEEPEASCGILALGSEDGWEGPVTAGGESLDRPARAS
jgi:radical SAM PhpK family P-methyltransferase